MGEHPDATAGTRNILLRGLFMVFMGLVFHLSGTLLFVVAVVQFAFALIGGAPNARLVSFGRSLGRYVQQNADFLSFVTEEKPFPFSDWPT